MITKNEIVERVAANNNYNKSVVKKVVNDFFTIMRQDLLDGNVVRISGIGTFELKAVAAAPKIGFTVSTAITVALNNKVKGSANFESDEA